MLHNCICLFECIEINQCVNFKANSYSKNYEIVVNEKLFLSFYL